jgi:hypothetical protein
VELVVFLAMKQALSALSVLSSLWCGAVSLEAQVDSNLLRREWRLEDHWADTYDKPFYIFKDNSDNSGERYGAFHWDSNGRIKTDSADRDPSFWLGYKILTIGIVSDDKFFDHGLYDVGLAFAGRLGAIGGGWTLEAAGGVATANDGTFSNTEAIYPAATLAAIRELSPHEFLQLGMTYDGNSALLPALPLPLVEYEARINPSLRLRAGFPHCEVEVRPVGDFSLLLIAEYPSDARVHAEVDVGVGFRVFGEFVRRIDPFHMHDAGRERVFYQLHTVEGGLRYANTWIDLSLSGGWAFSQEFFTGYDLRERDQRVRPSDRPLIALTVQGTF